jgi:Cdc6-like AAA superfamily ATPase
MFAVAKFVRETQLVDAAFFARPLWEGTELTSEWRSVVDIGSRFMHGIGLSVQADLYSAVYQGRGVVIDAVPGGFDKWSSPPPASNAIPNPPPANLSPSPAPTPEPAAAAPTKIPDVWMLADRPLEDHFEEQDLLRFKDYASALATILDHEKTDTPFTMAINAPWGAGKTTLANMVASELRQRPKDRGQEPHIICWFNAWMHDDAPNLATAFVAEVSRTANRHRRWVRRIFWPLPWGVLYPSSRRWRQVAGGIVVVALALALSWWLGSHLQQIEEATNKDGQRQVVITRDASGKEVRTETVTRPEKADTATPLNPVDRLLKTIESRVGVLGAFFAALAGLIGLLLNVIPSRALGGFVESPEKAAEAGAIQAAENQLKNLIKQATYRGNRFVVFVDDIERCTPPRSIDVLDAINQLMDHKNVVVVLLGDMAAVAAAAQLKYKDLAEIYVPNAGIALTGPDRGKEAFGRLYLQKIIQFQFDLPIPGKEKIQDYMRRLAVTRDIKGAASGAGTT